MAEFNSYLLGKARKSVGNITLCYTRGKNIVKAKVFARKDNPTPEVLTQRAKLKALVGLNRQLLPVIRKGFAGVGQGTTSNAFVSLNMQAVAVNEQYEPTVDFERLLVASGLLYTPNVTVNYDAEEGAFTFNQEVQEEESGYAFTSDKVYAVLYESTLGRARLVTLKNRGEGGRTSFTLPSDWEQSNVQIYCFATLQNGRAASDSVAIAC